MGCSRHLPNLPRVAVSICSHPHNAGPVSSYYITAYLFLEYKCNLDCWYCWSFDNKVKGMTEDVARRSIDWLHGNGCRVLTLMGAEPLLRPDFVHKVGCPFGKPA